jgi:predicted phage terminase large subunit-like protein
MSITIERVIKAIKKMPAEEARALYCKVSYSKEWLHRKAMEIFTPELKDTKWETPELHRGWYEHLESQDRYVAIIAPVGFAKSSVLKSYAVMELLENVSFVLYVSSTYTKSVGQFAGICKVLESDEVMSAKEYKILKKNESEIVLEMKDGETKGITAVASGADISGINLYGKRPELILIDDIEELDQARSITRTDKLQDWLRTTLFSRLPSLTLGRVRLIGTVFSKSSIANRIKTNYIDENGNTPFCDWIVHTYQAITGGKSIWEAKHPTHALLAERERDPLVFARNYQNEPVDERGGLVEKLMFRYFSTPPAGLSIYAYFDLASSLKEKADYFAGLVIGKSREGNFYILDIVRDKCNPEKQAEWIIHIWQKWKPSRISFESNQYQQTLKHWTDKKARESGVYMNLTGVSSVKDKYTRFSPFIPYFISNSIYLPSEHPLLSKLESEIIAFPEGEHDDLVDAFSGCMQSFAGFKGVKPGLNFVEKV